MKKFIRHVGNMVQ